MFDELSFKNPINFIEPLSSSKVTGVVWISKLLSPVNKIITYKYRLIVHQMCYLNTEKNFYYFSSIDEKGYNYKDKHKYKTKKYLINKLKNIYY